MSDTHSSGAADDRQNRSRRFRVRDFLANAGVSIASPDDRLSPDDTLVQGDFLHRELRPGLELHCSNVMEERPFTATSTLPEGLSCIFFLDGAVDLTLGEREFHFAARRRNIMTGTAIMNARSERFQRSSLRRQHLSHIVVSVSPEWLDLDGLRNFGNAPQAKRFLNNHLSEHRWALTPRIIELIDQILQPSPLIPQLHDLFLEGRAVEIVAESLAASLAAEPELDRSSLLTRHDHIKLRRAIDFIRSNLDAPLSVDRIARQAGLSASGLQRLFRVAENLSVFDYVRFQRLERAHLLLKTRQVTIQEASIVAGYSSPANFSTAFRRHFGFTPREATR